MSLYRSRRKGFSPLVGAVVLIAFTMAIAGILTAWATDFTLERSQQLGNQSEQLVGCTYAGLDVSDAEFNSANSETDVSVENTGTRDFNNVSVVAFRGASIQGKAFIANLQVGSVKTVTIIDTDDKPDSIRASSRDCPGVASEETSISTS